MNTQRTAFDKLLLEAARRMKACYSHVLTGHLLCRLQIGMLLYSYFACSFTAPGYVPQHWSPFPDPEVQQAVPHAHTVSPYALEVGSGSCRANA